MFCNTLVKKILKLSQEFMCTATGAFIEDSSPQKNAGKQLSMKFFAALASTNAGRKNSKRRKMILPLR